jgi:uncharacterized protein YcbX
MTASVESLMRYPVKGLSGEALQHVQLDAGQGFPGDRQFGFARPNSGFDINDPKPLPKTKFYMLARDAILVLLKTEYDDKSGLLTIATPQATSQFCVTKSEGKKAASEFLKTYLELPEDETPQLFQASPHRFTDVSVVSKEMMNAVSIINLDSVSAFSTAIGQEVDPRRFRGNIMISGLPPFSELDGVDHRLRVGAVHLSIVKRTKRCPATEVNLLTGLRDIKVPQLLRQHYGHMDMGVYCQVLEGGKIYPGDEIELL